MKRFAKRIALCGVCTLLATVVIAAFEGTSYAVWGDSPPPDIAKTRASMFAEVPKLAEDYTKAMIAGNVRKMYRLTASLQVDSLDALTRDLHNGEAKFRHTEFLAVGKPVLLGPRLALVIIQVRVQRKSRDGKWIKRSEYENVSAVRENGAWRVYHMVHTEKLEFPCHVDILLNSSLTTNPAKSYRAMNIDRPVEIIKPTLKPRKLPYDTWASAELRHLRSQGRVLWSTDPDLIRVSGQRYYFTTRYVFVKALGQPMEADYEMCAEKYPDSHYMDGWYWRLVSIKPMGSKPVTDPCVKATALSQMKGMT
jgi:hypothetical protein